MWIIWIDSSRKIIIRASLGSMTSERVGTVRPPRYFSQNRKMQATWKLNMCVPVKLKIRSHVKLVITSSC